MKLIFNDVISPRERTIRCVAIAEESFDAYIIWKFVPHRRRACACSHARIRHEGQELVVDLDSFRRVIGLRLRLRHHHGDGLANVPRFIRWQ